ncbi:MAG: cell division protein FtsK [Frankiales bacterium]|nr:cell division protein FtsK [Frankiales bacterium]
MRTTLTAVDVVTTEHVDLLLELNPADRVATLEATITKLLPATSPGLWLGAQQLDPGATITEAGVLPGCVLAVGGPGPERQRPHDPLARAELHVVSGPDAGTLHPLADGDTVVGRAADLSLCDPDLADRHLRLHSGPAGVVATPVGGSDIRSGGQPLAGPTAVGADDLLEVGSSLLAVVPTAVTDVAVTPGPDLTRVINRPPRLRPAPVAITVELPAVPAAPEPRRLAVLPLVLPVLLGVVMALVSSPLFLLFTLLSPVLALGGWWSDRRSGRASWATATAEHAEALAAATGEIAQLVLAETVARREAYPDAVALLLTATRPGPRVWERRRSDDDSLVLRVGTGPASPSSVRVVGTRDVPHPTLLDVPVTVALREVGVLGIAGPSAVARALGRWLIGQAAVLHSPRDLSVLLLIDPAAPPSEQDWGWLRWLPHTAPTLGQDCAALVGTTDAALTARVAELTAVIAARRAVSHDVRAQPSSRRQPDLLVVLDGARALRGLAGMVTVLQDGPAVGVQVVCLDEQQGQLPEECQAVVSCDGDARLTLRQAGEPDRAGTRADLVSPAWADRVARALAPLRDAGSDPGQVQLPPSARLLDVLGLGNPTAEAVLAQMGRTTEAVIGVDADGPFTVDLRRDGPHMLVAGTTGAGKSELLQTLVASLAVANRPDAMTFVLIDYKGGAAFKDCARLPHTVGMVTDLDGHLVERALASLTAELKAREQLLGEADAKDLEEFWSSGGCLPRLVIVIDEFASLVEELPDFVRGLVGIAQRGRSLGIHLVLATQRPSGVVSPEIRANTNLRIALRVTEATESLDVIDAPDAMTVARSTPGRGYARAGHACLTAFQSARVGGHGPGATVTVPVDVHELPWSRVGDPLPLSARTEREPPQDQTDLHALVLAVQQAVSSLGLPPARSPWLDPLAASLTLDDVRRSTSAGGPGLPPVIFGLEDLPAEQARRAAALDLEQGGHLLVAGAPRSGRSTLLRTLGASLAGTISPADAHLYCLDCGNGTLLPLAALPHCGAVVSRTQVERADRLLSRLTAEVARRQELLAGGGFADLAEQRAASADPLPYLVLLVDSWEGFTGAFEEVDAGRMTDTFLRLLREGPGAGLRVVVTGDRGVLLGKVASAVEDVLCLRLADRSDYSLAGLSPRLLPKEIGNGRGFRGDIGSAVQVALLVEDASGPAQAAAVAGHAEQWSGRHLGGRRPFRVEVLPARITVAEAKALGAVEPGRLRTAIGVGGDELGMQSVDLAVHGPGFTIAGPPRSGRSTALLGAAQGLLAGGTGLCVLAPRPSPLRDLREQRGVLHLWTSGNPDPADVAAALDTAAGPLAVVVDDAELLHGTDVSDLLQQVLRDGPDRGHVVLLAGTTAELATSFRGFTADARRSRSGLVLSPTSHLEGELLGVRLPRSAAFAGPPGRGLLVRTGQVQLVQVPLP